MTSRAPPLLLAAGLVLASAPAHATAAGATPNPRTDFTAYTRPAGRVAFGPLKLELGVIDELTIGTYVPQWFAFPLLGVPLPNVYLKARSWWSGPLTLALRGSTMYVASEAVEQLASGDASGSVTALSAEADLSLLVHRRLTVSLGAELTFIRANGNDTEESATSVEGAVAADNLMSRLFVEWRLSRVFSLTLLVRYMLVQSPVAADTTFEGSGVTVDARLTADTTAEHRGFSVVPRRVRVGQLGALARRRVRSAATPGRGHHHRTGPARGRLRSGLPLRLVQLKRRTGASASPCHLEKRAPPWRAGAFFRTEARRGGSRTSRSGGSPPLARI
jgi:hypothetical protein